MLNFQPITFETKDKTSASQHQVTKSRPNNNIQNKNRTDDGKEKISSSASIQDKKSSPKREVVVINKQVYIV